MRRAFTLIELIITMVILSIVAYIASGLIAKTYIGYNQTNTLNRANLKLEIALNEITNRLEYAVPNSIVKRKSATNTAIAAINSAPLDYNVLEWVGVAKDSFNANASNLLPGWSGYCNVNASSKKSIVTAGSNLILANTIITKLSNGQVTLNNSKAALFFIGEYDYNDIGYSSGAPTKNIGIIKNFSSNKFTLVNDIKSISEHYKLAWSAYAVVPVNYNAAEKTFDLELKYNFRPWLNEHYNSKNTPKTTLVKGVTVFKTYATQNRVHIKLCIKDKYGINKTTSICKEKVVFR
jgi:prepilin-type N-terminal cleavage/methylation domain-containing protein